jgi:hypothetical protein
MIREQGHQILIVILMAAVLLATWYLLHLRVLTDAECPNEAGDTHG